MLTQTCPMQNEKKIIPLIVYFGYHFKTLFALTFILRLVSHLKQCIYSF